MELPAYNGATYPAAPLFPKVPEKHVMANKIRADKGAGIDYETDSGVVDFHARRGSGLSRLVNDSRGPLKVLQDFARHSDPKLNLPPYEVKNGEGGIRTPGTGINPFDGLANRWFQPLTHLSQVFAKQQVMAISP